ncbi:MAG TPA: hypothetical protein DD473_27485 [Planctomycetaceae bacterium]|nr:hypothetical protein [Planctomycetaceae bacterium]
MTLIGSANQDRRSFDLNYENNILCYDSKITGEERDLQLMHLSKSDPVTEEMFAEWSLADREDCSSFTIRIERCFVRLK